MHVLSVDGRGDCRPAMLPRVTNETALWLASPEGENAQPGCGVVGRHVRVLRVAVVGCVAATRVVLLLVLRTHHASLL